MKVVSTPDTRLHDPSAEIWVGVPIEGTEVAARVDVIEERLVADGHEVVDPVAVPPGIFETVHDPGLVAFLRSAWDQWQESNYPSDPGQDRVVPYVFPLHDVTSGRPPRRPASVAAIAGLYAMDTMTLIGPGTWRAVEAAAACAITGADMLLETGEPVYALCRPPGHHAGTTFYGGSCYLNNAAMAAARLQKASGGRVAVVDLDAHHGNGTQQIFYERSDVIYASLHIDPAAGYFPHFLGYGEERGTGAGDGANLNIPLALGTGDEGWLHNVGDLLDFVVDADIVVVSLGVDAWKADPESPLDVSEEGFDMAGRLVGSINKPTLVCQEGGYDLTALGGLVASFLDGLAAPSQSPMSG